MTDNEAILILRRSRIQNVNDDNFEKAFEMAISALTEIQKYRTLGTVEEIEPYIRLAEKLNVCDLVRENANLYNKLKFIEIELRETKEPIIYKGTNQADCPICRLTERLNDELHGIWVKDHDYISAAKKLADYEDLGLTPEQIREMDRIYSEQAKELEGYRNADNQEKPLCKIGDTVYFIYTGLKRGILEGKVNNISITEEGIRYYAGYCSDFADYDIGKTVFLTEAQAEAALQKM